MKVEDWNVTLYGTILTSCQHLENFHKTRQANSLTFLPFIYPDYCIFIISRGIVPSFEKFVYYHDGLNILASFELDMTTKAMLLATYLISSKVM